VTEELKYLGRSKEIFFKDILKNKDFIESEISNSRFLIIGGAGSIGSSVAKQIFSLGARQLDVVDISENYLVELVRDIRCSLGYVTQNFNVYCLDYCSELFSKFMENKKYDYVYNLAALKHVRSEQHFETALRMIDVNIIGAYNLYEKSLSVGCKKYFCVSTDKATNPANLMGATKRTMELALFNTNSDIPASFARFANVLLSHGSLTENFLTRIVKRQPISLPSDIERYFILSSEAGRLCLMSSILGEKNEIFVPKLSEDIKPINFVEILERILEGQNLKPVWMNSEQEARESLQHLNLKRYWPVYTFKTDTTGEKYIEEFYTVGSKLDLKRFDEVGVITNSETAEFDIKIFLQNYDNIKNNRGATIDDLITLISDYVPEFEHKKTRKNLNDRM
jgi:FlaA1/EpsC-like NDP-sugar epimerase